MQIHELNTFEGTPSSGTYLAIDNGSDTSKIPASRLFGIYYGISSTSAGTSTKTVTCADFTNLYIGATIAVNFTNANTSISTACKLNVNGTGAKPIVGTAMSTTSTSRIDGAWEAGEVKVFVYDGTNWVVVDRNIITASELTSLESKLGI